MRTITHSDLRNQSGQVLRDAEAGATFIVTNHGRPVAAIGPVPPSEGLKLSRPASKHGFADLARHRITTSTQEILEETRRDRD